MALKQLQTNNVIIAHRYLQFTLQRDNLMFARNYPYYDVSADEEHRGKLQFVHEVNLNIHSETFKLVHKECASLFYR